jgi:uncharacterized protein (TIGR03083 family)
LADYATIYREAQGRVMSLVNNQNAATPIPACPGWTVKDVVAHVTGVLDDHRIGNFEGAPGPEWTTAQVEKRRVRSLADIGAEWHLLAHTHPRILASEYGQTYAVDLISHEFDIRGAIGNTEGRTLPWTRTAALFFLNVLDHLLKEDGLPALRIQVEDKALTVGAGQPAGTVTLTWFEMLRTLSGRRSRAQVRALPWEGDPGTWMDHLFVFGPAEIEIVE